jgi:hypothetical protein
VSELRIRALDRLHKKLEHRRADRGPDPVGAARSVGSSSKSSQFTIRCRLRTENVSPS